MPNIDHTIHLNKLFTLIEFVQEAGRAGQDPSITSTSTLIIKEKELESLKSISDCSSFRKLACKSEPG